MGVDDDSATVSPDVHTMDLNQMYGLYLLGHYPVSENGSIYGLLGWTSAGATIKSKLTGLSVNDTEDGHSLGIGAEYKIGNSASLSLEYVNYFDDDNFDLSSVNLGVSMDL